MEWRLDECGDKFIGVLYILPLLGTREAMTNTQMRWGRKTDRKTEGDGGYEMGKRKRS
jgi:hypothetical protein